MRRLLVPSLLALLLAGALPSHAETTSVVVSSANQYLPGDDDYGRESGAPGILGLEITHLRGRQMQYVNADTIAHTLQAVCALRSCGAPADGTPDFGSASLVQPGGTVDVARVSGLAVGSYAFKCGLHGTMRGTLTVIQA